MPFIKYFTTYSTWHLKQFLVFKINLFKVFNLLRNKTLKFLQIYEVEAVEIVQKKIHQKETLLD